ncbi:MAG: M23 family metallopeptidase [Marinobacter sp.]|uniref:M23 family metallopeptidase n=1 Tax=Marinobacter sp. TaxID=50741 RepID=UPI00299D70B9|nr:M23 family metallopeptidase [Marinobacter sp.]MDX1755773.1 M23 family metallopeptidase [Marinobacter sp.]
MNIILVGKKHGESRVLAVTLPLAALVLCLVLALVGGAAWLGYRAAQPVSSSESEFSPAVIAAWQERLSNQQRELAELETLASQQVDALTLRLGEMQGRLLRLDAMGQRFVESGLIASDEFDFDQPAAVGGPEDTMPGESYTTPELSAMIGQLETRIADREQQLRLLDSLISRQQIEKERFVAGRPITWGWLSSRYGYRSDPFTGRRTWHSGVDLAGKDGSDIIAVAAGVVTYADDRHGYGNLVEIDHGDGLVTRYAHCKTIQVEVGDIVQKGQVVALMGSTGRSTGPHVHFEVLRNGKSQNPEHYIQRASR